MSLSTLTQVHIHPQGCSSTIKQFKIDCWAASYRHKDIEAKPLASSPISPKKGYKVSETQQAHILSRLRWRPKWKKSAKWTVLLNRFSVSCIITSKNFDALMKESKKQCVRHPVQDLKSETRSEPSMRHFYSMCHFCLRPALNRSQCHFVV